MSLMNGTAGTRNRNQGPVPVKEAAAILGITDRAVRKRIAAGTMHADQVNGAWFVYLDRVEPRAGTAGSSSEDGTWNRNSGTDVATQFGVALQQMQAPLIAKIGELERELGREQVRREQAEQQLAELQSRLNTLPMEPSEPATPAPAPAPGPQVPPHRQPSTLARFLITLARRF